MLPLLALLFKKAVLLALQGSDPECQSILAQWCRWFKRRCSATNNSPIFQWYFPLMEFAVGPWRHKRDLHVPKARANALIPLPLGILASFLLNNSVGTLQVHEPLWDESGLEYIGTKEISQ